MNAVKVYGAMEVQFQLFLNSVLDRDEWRALSSAAGPDKNIRGGRADSTVCIDSFR
jgi:hypothetical protein